MSIPYDALPPSFNLHNPQPLLTARSIPQTSGLTGRLPHDNPSSICLLAGCTAIAWAFAFELAISAFITFPPPHRGLYFYSLLVSSAGCALHALGFVLKFLVGEGWGVCGVFIMVGWVAMVTGQAFVLYSRLNLVVRRGWLLKWVRWQIIVDAVVLHTPSLVILCGINSPGVGSAWVPDFNVIERIQLMGFCLQESVLSGIYIVATVKLLGVVYQMRVREAMVQLLMINFICIGMDMVLIGLEFSNNYVGEASVKPLIYAIKLKLEFAVYKQLMGFTKAAFTDPNAPDVDSDTVVGGGGSPNTIAVGPPYNGGAIPKRKLLALRKPSVPTVPTIHTHPAQILKAERVDIKQEWDSSRTDLNPSAMAAALTAEKPSLLVPAPSRCGVVGARGTLGGRRRSWRSRSRSRSKGRGGGGVNDPNWPLGEEDTITPVVSSESVAPLPHEGVRVVR